VVGLKGGPYTCRKEGVVHLHRSRKEISETDCGVNIRLKKENARPKNNGPNRTKCSGEGTQYRGVPLEIRGKNFLALDATSSGEVFGLGKRSQEKEALNVGLGGTGEKPKMDQYPDGGCAAFGVGR